MQELAWCRALFPSLRRQVDGRPAIFFDGPGGSQVPYPVIEAVSRYYRRSNANTHGAFVTSQETDHLIWQTRERVAQFLGISNPALVAFGPNMTTLAFAVSRALEEQIHPGDAVVVTALDHDANVAPWLRYQRRGAEVLTVPVRGDGTLDLDALSAFLERRPRLLAVGWASNALGTVNDLRRLRAWTRQSGTWLVVDAVHWAPHGPIDVEGLDPDILFCSAYKFFGPHVGIAYIHPDLAPLLRPDSVRPKAQDGVAALETGTLNHAALAGLSAAIEFIAHLSGQPDPEPTRPTLVQAMEAVYAYEHGLARRLYRGLQALPGVEVLGPPVESGTLRAPTLSIRHRTKTAPELSARLGARGIFTWAGDFYAYNLAQAWNLQASGGILRFGLAPYNTAEEVDRALDQLSALVSEGP
ncbi:MAG: cysteine desulfurase-like protein [Firmicutes bacterium]|nr:cysteine desulfurase-like protein [Bacillota bacterium]